MRAGRHDLAPRMIAGGMLFGAGFLGVKVIEYSDKINHDLVPGTNDFFLYYYLLTGLHAFHVTVGMIVLTILLVLSRKRKEEFTKGQWAFFEGGACFWHMVDLLWILLFPAIYLIH